MMEKKVWLQSILWLLKAHFVLNVERFFGKPAEKGAGEEVNRIEERRTVSIEIRQEDSQENTHLGS